MRCYVTSCKRRESTPRFLPPSFLPLFVPSFLRCSSRSFLPSFVRAVTVAVQWMTDRRRRGQSLQLVSSPSFLPSFLVLQTHARTDFASHVPRPPTRARVSLHSLSVTGCLVAFIACMCNQASNQASNQGTRQPTTDRPTDRPTAMALRRTVKALKHSIDQTQVNHGSDVICGNLWSLGASFV